MVERRLGDLEEMRRWDVGPLHAILLSVIRDGDDAVITDTDYLHMLGIRMPRASANDVWRHLIAQTIAKEAGWSEWKPALEVILERGCLSRRLLRALGNSPSRSKITEVYRGLTHCLAGNKLFV
jgi:carboxylate-amine ligase